MVFPKYKALVQVHGCFWHRHPGCVFSTNPASNVIFWKSKFRDTIKRDRRNFKKLFDAGWRIAIVWECKLGGEDDANSIASLLAKWLKGNRRFVEIPRVKSRTAVVARPRKIR
jgi:DNA mismatch endonuclease (patch repair protein)